MYQIFAGKDGSRGLGKSSLKPEDAVSDYSTLDESERVVLDDWVKYFTKVRAWLTRPRTVADELCAALQHCWKGRGLSGEGRKSIL